MCSPLKDLVVLIVRAGYCRLTIFHRRTLKEHIVDYDSDGRPALELVEWNIILTVDLQ